MALLTLDKVSKAFGGVTAVKGVSLALEAGEVLGVMGPGAKLGDTILISASALFSSWLLAV
jgi:branched-chain amino acid transport system ATP-binding protein